VFELLLSLIFSFQKDDRKYLQAGKNFSSIPLTIHRSPSKDIDWHYEFHHLPEICSRKSKSIANLPERRLSDAC
jgi:hypothetical protein